jgi:hypothetical protein
MIKNVLELIWAVAILALWILFIMPSTKHGRQEGYISKGFYIIVRVLGYLIIAFEIFSLYFYAWKITGQIK